MHQCIMCHRLLLVGERKTNYLRHHTRQYTLQNLSNFRDSELDCGVMGTFKRVIWWHYHWQAPLNIHGI